MKVHINSLKRFTPSVVMNGLWAENHQMGWVSWKVLRDLETLAVLVYP